MQLTYLGSNISSVESNINICIVKAGNSRFVFSHRSDF